MKPQGLVRAGHAHERLLISPRSEIRFFLHPIQRLLNPSRTAPSYAKGALAHVQAQSNEETVTMFAWFESLINPFPDTQPQQPPKTLAAFCWHFAKDVKFYLLLTSAFAASIAILEILLFSYLGSLVDMMSASTPETFFTEHGTTLITMGLIVLFAMPILVLFGAMLIHNGLMGNFPMIMRWQGHRYLLNQSLGFFQDEFAGRIATKLMQSSLAMREVVMKLVDILVFVSVYFVGMVVLAASESGWLSIPFLIWLVLYVGMLRYFVPRLQDVSKEQADKRAIMTGRVVDSYTNIQTVKLFSHAQRESAYAKDGMRAFLTPVHWQMRYVTQFEVGLYALNCLLITSVALMSILLWQSGIVTLGAIAVSVAMVMRLNGMSQWIMWEVSQLFENIGTVQDGIDILAREQDVIDQPDAKTLSVEQGDIHFEGVRFHYGRETKVIEHLDLNIKPGERVGLVGRSGAGKSTLVNLLLRFHDLEGGRITIDGTDIAHVTQESLRSQIGLVTQDTSLLHRSVFDNIAYGRPHATHEEVVAAAERAEAMGFIDDLADIKGRQGLEAHVGERGVKLSGGQRQRIAIARVFLKDAPILLLDEATSALDSEVEAAIQDRLYDLMAGKTVIAIAHRLSTIAAMDRLIVMDKGRIVEEGTHDDLVALGGLYAQLWQRQSGGFLQVDPLVEEAAAE